ncbi:MAG: M28 family peptidase [Candidatus Manganitrophaceae bacterium]
MPLEKTMSSPANISKDCFQNLPKRLKAHVDYLAGEIGERNFANPTNLELAAKYIHDSFKSAGYNPLFEEFRIGKLPWLTKFRTSRNEKGFLKEIDTFKNISASLAGSSREVIVVGAHYDTVLGTPGADDNASGIAALLELSRLLQGTALEKTITFVAFGNEEPPFFRTSAMGSAHYVAASVQAGQQILFMISLEMLGFYSDEPFSQKYPPILKFFYPHQANFIALVGNIASRRYVKRMVNVFKENCNIGVESIAAPRFVPGIDFSDQLNFWKRKIPAVMVTDTAFYRNAHYHRGSDLPSALNYEKMAEVVKGAFAFLLEISTLTRG